jgi:hypothetical protein
MKIRKQRKRTLKHIQQNKYWDWAIDKFMGDLVTATSKMSKALQEAYAKARNEQQAHSG